MRSVDLSHEHFDILCALSAVNQNSADEEERLEEHLRSCGDCRQRMVRYREVAEELFEDSVTQTLPTTEEANIEDDRVNRSRIKSEVLAACRGLEQFSGDGEFRRFAGKTRPALLFSFSSMVKIAATAALLLALGLTLFQVRTLKRRAADLASQSLVSQTAVKKLQADLAVARATHEPSVVVQQQSVKPDPRVKQLEAELGARSGELAESEAARNELAEENSQFQDRLKLVESSLEVVQASSDRMKAEKEQLAARVSELSSALQKSHNEIASLTEQVSVKDRSADRNEKLLATDHDIIEILGSRGLRMIDVLDVDPTGETRPPFGRIFYTEGKNLIFYAFNLDEQRGLKRNVQFVAWGKRLLVKDAAYRLGTFYENDPQQNRWILKVEDTKILSRIDYVFVTDGSSKDGAKPKGRQLLSASLAVAPNHP